MWSAVLLRPRSIIVVSGRWTMNDCQRYVLDHATLWIGDGHSFEGHVVVAGDRIEVVERDRFDGALPTVDLEGAALSPGLVDIMVCGGFNLSLLHDDPVEIARRLLPLGVTTCQLAVGTLTEQDLVRVCDKARAAVAYDGLDAARITGVYFEGPFYDRACVGGNNADLVWPATAVNVERFLDMCGHVTPMVNISPGIDGDAEAIALLKGAGKRVAMSHSAAGGDRVVACIEAGASQIGHIFNNGVPACAEPGVHRPHLDYVGLADDRIEFVHVISDGTHVHPVMINLALQARGIEAICLVSDANNLGGAPDGPFTFDSGLEAIKKDGVGRLLSGQLAGSARLLPDDFRNFVTMTGLPPHEAIRAATLNAATAVGLEDQVGILAPHRSADFVAWDSKLSVRRVWRGGQEVEHVSDFAEVVL
jgi:N-acetylglucosamine-6-phosphate deacetylase